MTVLSKDKQYKIEPVVHLMRLQRAKGTRRTKAGKPPDTGPCSVHENKIYVLLRRTSSRHMLDTC
jgi:hypothetical protein